MNTDSKNNEKEQCTIPVISGITYLAFMRIDYEGIFESSMKLFKNKTEADKYICSLRKKHGNGSFTYDIKELYCH
jgi:hypothetical protein